MKHQRTILIAICVVLGLVLAGLIGAAVWVDGLLGKVDRVEEEEEQTLSSEEAATMTEEPEEETHTGPTVLPEDIEPVVTTPTVSQKEGTVNILLVGQDRREGQGRQRSDAMILCTFDSDRDTVTLTSFLRDTYVYIPGYGHQKLNAAYAYGGFRLLNETLAVNFGVHVDGNVEVDFSGFTGIIDLLGGVDIELSQAEVDYMITNGNFEYSDGSDWDLKPGINRLTGDQALAYARIRKLDSDFGRTGRQRKVLLALIDQCRGQKLSTLLELVDQVLPLVTTNLTDGQIVRYATRFFPMLSGSINTRYIPAAGTYTEEYVSGVGACLIPDLEKNRQILQED